MTSLETLGSTVSTCISQGPSGLSLWQCSPPRQPQVVVLKAAPGSQTLQKREVIF